MGDRYRGEKNDWMDPEKGNFLNTIRCQMSERMSELMGT